MSRIHLLTPPLVLSLALAATTGAAAADPAAVATAADPAQIEFFEKKIRPVLVRECYECHAADSKVLQAGLRLDNRDGMMQGGDGGPVVVPGNAKKSGLIAALKHESTEMPPKGRLPDDVIADFEHWINQGAADPRDGTATATAATTTIDVEKGRQFWAFVPPRAHPRPAVRDASWPKREYDWFVRAAQEEKKLTPVGPASKEEWLRRVTFDLIGLPPSIAEIDAFLADESPESFAKVVDRLLAAEGFGERWARHWLDVARYANDLGGVFQPTPAPHAFRYRDWVVNAFNADMPYDQFLRLQLAGDMLAEPKDDAVTRLAGLGFQGVGLKVYNMGKAAPGEELDDRVDTLTRGLLGLTVSCARCHDHKFDPIPTRDYYSLAAAYNGSQWNAELPLASPEEVTARQDWLKRKAELDGRDKNLLEEESERVGRAELVKLAAYLEAAWQAEVLTARKLPPDLPALAKRHGLEPTILERLVKAPGTKQFEAAGDALKAWRAAVVAAVPAAAAGEGDVDVPPAIAEASQRAAAVVAEAWADLDRLRREQQEKKPKPEPLKPEHDLAVKILFQNNGAAFKFKPEAIPAFFTAEARQRHESLTRERAEHAKSEPPDPLLAPGVKGGGVAMKINIRGDQEKLGALAPPGFLQVLSQPASSGTAAATFTRLDLAAAIASRDNPLTARVFVNRVWHHLFGRGLVGTLSNFGQLGERPSHPELLDTLAVHFMEHGWSTKWLVREITLSATYRLSSRPDEGNQRLDGDNQLLWRMTPRRLEFEVWRDATLAVAGKLDRTLGGPPLSADGKQQLHPQDPAHGRRTLYCFVSRFKPNPTLTLFDVPEPNGTSERRNVTAIPQQQLFALNSPFMGAMSKAFADRLAKEAADDAARIDRAWRLAFARSPSPDERQAALDYLKSSNQDWPQLCHGILLANEFLFLP
jgi:cytochrome c553